MVKYSSQFLSKLDKSKLVKLLQKEGIDASPIQTRGELIRMLMLAHTANSPTHLSYRSKKMFDRKNYYILGLFVLVLITMGFLYFFNPVFNNNLNFIVGKVTAIFQSSDKNPDKDSGPVIYEKNGKTYVVYDYPMTRVKVLVDPDCKRPECDLEDFRKEIKKNITPLVNFEEVNYDSWQGKSLIKDLKLTLLPIFIFDKGVERADSFEDAKKFFTKVDDKYVLRVQPYKTLEGANLNNGQVLGLPVDQNAPITIVVYASPSSAQTVDILPVINELLRKYKDKITIVFKYFNSTPNDLSAGVALECAAQQSKFYDLLNLIVQNQEKWIDLKDTQLLGRFLAFTPQVSISASKFSKCFNSDDNVKQIVQGHFTESATMNITGAPAFILNNNILLGAYPLDNFITLINDILPKQ